MQNVIEIQMLNGAKMPVEVEVKTDFYGVRTVSRIFGQYFQLMVQGGNMCIYIQPKRDIDSDMGHLQTWAMPDGTTKETFSHAY